MEEVENVSAQEGEQNKAEDEESVQRPKRRRVDKSGRTEALAKFRNLKGKKHKCDLNEIENVYDVVDEEEYRSRMQQKASENWLEEDDEGDYVEDGREIFDEDEVVEEKKKRKSKKAEQKQEELEAATKNVPKISKFFGRETNINSKKEKLSEAASDDLLSKVLNELGTNVKTEVQSQSSPLNLDDDDDGFADHINTATVATTTKEEESVATSLKAWEAVAKAQIKTEPETPEETQELPQENLNMWLWDIWEDTNDGRGQLFLFGKVEKNGTYSSICVQIQDIERRLYLLPRLNDLNTGEPVSMKDVYDEWSNTIAPSLDIPEHKSKQVTKNHVFSIEGVDVPQVSDYLMVCYSGSKRVPVPNKPYKKIAYIFNTQASSTETFILEKEIKGPCWITLTNYNKVQSNATWCKNHVKCEKMSMIQVATFNNQSPPPPPLTIMSFNVRVAVDNHNKNEVVAVSCLINRKFFINKPPPKIPIEEHFCILGRPSNKPFPFDFKVKSDSYTDTKIIKCENELALLNCILAKIHLIDPDLVVTQDAYARQLDVLVNRIISRKISTWSKLGKLRFKNKFANHRKVEEFFIGRMICDVKSSAEELKSKMRSYDLQSLCTNILKIPENDRRDIFVDEVPTFYESSEKLLNFITLTMQDNLYSMRIMCELNCLPLALQITNIAGNLMGHTLRGGRSERNEYLLLHAFMKLNHIPPEKPKREIKKKKEEGEAKDDKSSKKKAQYTGGLVLDPIKGFYDNFILLMDFNSLYPSIIQEYNICYTTIDKSKTIPDSSIEMGILPFQIKKLVERRRQVKNLMKASDLHEDLKMQYDIRQMALKLTANSMYGCLGFSHSRFYAPHLAELVTEKGREILMNTKALVEKQAHQVVYGDTDSIMVLTNSRDFDQVLGIGNSIKQVINKIYKHVELDIDGIFKYLLLLKKKKYAATVISRGPDGKLKESKEFKGLDIVRRDWCKLAQQAGERVLNEILSEKSADDKVSNIHQILEDIAKETRAGKIDLSSLEITKQLTRDIRDYPGFENIPHVRVAQRMNMEMNRNFKRGDVVGYVICIDGTDNNHLKRSYHLDELKCNKKLEIDTEYYLANQVYPVVSRLVEPIDGIEAVRVAECLTLDPKKYKIHNSTSQSGTNSAANENGEALMKSNAEKFRFCHKFIFSCHSCESVNPVAGMMKPDKTCPFEKCTNPDCKSRPYKFASYIENQLISTIRDDIKRFYDNWFICDDPLCSFNTRFAPHVTDLGKPICTKCHKGNLIRQYTERDLYTQLCYYKFMFSDASLQLPQELQQLRESLLSIVEENIKKSGYFLVKMALTYKGVQFMYPMEGKKPNWGKLLEPFK